MVTHMGLSKYPSPTIQTTTFRVFLIRSVTAERHSDDGVPADVLVSTMRTVTWRILPPVLIPLYKSPPVRHSKSQIVADVNGDQSVDADNAH